MWPPSPRPRRDRSGRSRLHPRFERLEDRAVPAVIPVSSLADSGPGTLRAAITEADADTTPDTITFTPSVTGTITLSTALPDLSAAITIAGPGASVLTVARSSAPGTSEFRIFTVPAGAEVTISGLTISGGASGDRGGGISNAGTLTVTGSNLSGNSGRGGGGISNSSTLTVITSMISGNVGLGLGGGIANTGMVTVTNSTVSGNHGESGPAGRGNGRGIYNQGTFTVTNSTISGNTAGEFILGGGDGGGIYNQGTFTLTNSTINGNHAFPGNGGGIDNSGTLTVTNSTISDNVADEEFSFGGHGQGINNSGTLTVATSIFANGGFGNGDFGNLGSVGTNPGTTIVSQGHNLFSDKPAVPLDPTDLVNTDPLLGPLADNGGPTQTQALLPGSPAIDAGVPIAGVTADQRGVPRPHGAAPDIGDFESRGFTITVVGGDRQAAPPRSPFFAPLVVAASSPFGEPVAGGTVAFSAPTTGPSAGFTDNPATIGADGRASVHGTANGLPGSYAVIAGASGAGRVALTLTNEGPAVVVRRLGIHARLVLTFNRPMSAATAQDLRNYTHYPIGPEGYGGPHPQPTPITSAVYDPVRHTVTLTPLFRLKLGGYYLLTVSGVGPHPVLDVNGNPLTGTGTGGKPGDFIALVHGYGPWRPAAPSAQATLAEAVPAGPRNLAGSPRH